MIGAGEINPTFLTPAYRRIFEKVNVPYKDRIIGFMATEDAVLPPGTVLDVRHFQVGQYVAVTGKTIDWGFQGGVSFYVFEILISLIFRCIAGECVSLIVWRALCSFVFRRNAEIGHYKVSSSYWKCWLKR
jgi:hypothetical protein